MVEDLISKLETLDPGPAAAEAGSSEDVLPSPEGEYRLPKRRLIALCVALSLGLFMSFLDTSITATAIFTIGKEFGSFNKINWIPLAYTLSDVGCAVLWTSLGDVVGRQYAYLAAYVMFLAFSIGCGFAHSINQLIALRALQGIGGSGLYSLAMVIIPEVSPQKMKKWIGAGVGMVVGMSGVLGPILGGIITNYTSWRWIFWINGPTCIISFSLFVIAWPRPGQIRHPEKRPLREVDSLGSVLLIASSVLVIFAFQEAGVLGDSWGKAVFIAPLVAGVICAFILVGWEVTVNRIWPETMNALFPSSLFSRRVYVCGVLTTMLTGFPYFMVIYNIPLHLQIINGKSPLVAGIGLLPLLVSTAIGSMLGGIASARRNNLFYTLTVGAAILTLGAGLLSTASDTHAVDPNIYGFEVLVGLGFGLVVSTSSILAAIECDLKDHAIAQGVVAQARILGGSFGIAASTAILGTIERNELSGLIPVAQILPLDFITLNQAQLEGVQQAYSDAFKKSLRVASIVSAVAFLLTLVSFQKHPLTLEERGKEQFAVEAARMKAKCPSAEKL